MNNSNQKTWQVYFLLIFAPILLFIATTVLIYFLFGLPPQNFDNKVFLSKLHLPIMASEWMLVLILFSFFKFSKREILKLGLSFKKWWLELLIGVGLFFILWGFTKYLLFPFLRILNLSKGPAIGYEVNFTKAGIFNSFIISVTAGFCEEIIWRGYALKYLTKIHNSPVIALIISSIFFGLFHWGYGLYGIVSTAIIGLIFGIIVLWRKNLLAVILIHFLVDFF